MWDTAKFVIWAGNFVTSYKQSHLEWDETLFGSKLLMMGGTETLQKYLKLQIFVLIT